MILKTPGSQMGSPAAAEEGGEEMGGGRWESGERSEVQAMMMIAFITVRSSLVPLIEGLCAQIYFRFEISVVCVHIFGFSFSEEKIC